MRVDASSTHPGSPVDSPRAGAGTRYECVKRCVYRAGFDLQSEFQGHLEAGTVITALESRMNSWEQLRVRFDQGWASVTAGDGGVLLISQNLSPHSVGVAVGGAGAAAAVIGAQRPLANGHVPGASSSGGYSAPYSAAELQQQMDRLRALDSPATGAPPTSRQFVNPHFDESDDEDGTGDSVDTDGSTSALPDRTMLLQCQLRDVVLELPPDSPEKHFAVHLAKQAQASIQSREWQRAQDLYLRALSKCGIHDQGPTTSPTDDLAELVANAIPEDTDNPLFGDEDVDGLIERLETPRPLPIYPRNERQEADDRWQWNNSLRNKGWGAQLKELTAQGWHEPPPEYDSIDSQLGLRLYVLEQGFGTLVRVQQRKRGWGPCTVDFVDGGKKSVILRLKGKEMGTPFLLRDSDVTGGGRESALR